MNAQKNLLVGGDDAPGLGPAVPEAPRDDRSRVQVVGKFLALGAQRLRIQGVTYGPFAPRSDGVSLPDRGQVARDFSQMRAIGVNAIRTYHVPPKWFFARAGEDGIAILVDVPWPKHLCFLESRRAQAEARRLVQQAAARGRNSASVLGYSIGNEIPPDVIRWHGRRRVERFLAELCDVAKQSDPDGLVTYANYPPSEYLDLSFLDFATFNLYLHDREVFRRYLIRLQNLVGDRPLLLGELGMDTYRHGELAQADFLAGHMSEVRLLGLAGAFVFAWTDEWYTGGCPIEDWAFGITAADRFPKPACHALRTVFEAAPFELLPERPRVSVVVCTYNGGRTLDECLRSLLALDYPDYEVIVVDDGSTDDTLAILARFTEVRAIHQPNRGLSASRNVGLRAATGTLIAYTDSDCFAPADWLTHLVDQLLRGDAAAVGGPNLTPEDGRLAACIAAAPGQPTHVLESDQVAEHIPGCNMAFRRKALEAINGFDPLYRKAGDDVDVCWRLQQAGHWITFAPGAFVWHHRRQTLRAYLKQQSGYGEAEALLEFKHPDRFNGRGDGLWRGVMYGACLRGVRLAKDVIYRGTFGTAFFQCLYEPGPAHWAMLPSTLEWHLTMVLVALMALLWPSAWALLAILALLSLGVAFLQALQARLAHQHEGPTSRFLIAGLCYLQPLIRSWQRYRTRLFSYCPPLTPIGLPAIPCQRMTFSGYRSLVYWSESGTGRTELLAVVIAYLLEHRWGKAIDSGWGDWDLAIYCNPWTIIRSSTAQEAHAGGKLLIRVRHRLRLTAFAEAVRVMGLVLVLVTSAFSQDVALVGAGLLVLTLLGAWWRGMRQAARALAVFDYAANSLGLIACPPEAAEETPPVPPRQPRRLFRWLRDAAMRPVTGRGNATAVRDLV